MSISTSMLILGIFAPGPVELVVIAVVILLLFGNRLPGVMRSLGRGVVEFKKGVSGEEEDESVAEGPPKEKRDSEGIKEKG